MNRTLIKGQDEFYVSSLVPDKEELPAQ